MSTGESKALHSKPRVLIYRLGSLGDTLVALPALRLIAKRFSGSEKRMLTNFSVSEKAAPAAALLDGTGLVDAYIRYPTGLRNPVALFKLIQEIRGWRPDVLVYLNEPRGWLRTLRDAIFFRVCGIRRMIGIPLARDLQAPQLKSANRYEHKSERLVRSIRSMGDAELSAPASWSLSLSDEERFRARSALHELDGCTGILAASIGAKVDAKDWEDENWRALLALLRQRLPGWGLVMIGAPVERERSAALVAVWDGPAVNLCGQLGLRESAAVLEASNVYVGHDSGPMHLSAAVGTTCIAIFSSRNLPGEWFPYGDNHVVFYKMVECLGCRLDQCIELKKRCILSIKAGEVADAVVAVTASGTARRCHIG